MAERIAADGMMKAVIDPLKVVCRVITDENAAPIRHREQPLLEVGEHLHRAECVQAGGPAAVRVTQAAGATDGARAEDLTIAVPTPYPGSSLNRRTRAASTAICPSLPRVHSPTIGVIDRPRRSGALRRPLSRSGSTSGPDSNTAKITKTTKAT